MRIGMSLTTIEPSISAGKIDGIGMYTQNLYHALLRQNQTITPISFPASTTPPASAFPNGRWFRHSYSRSTLQSLILPFSSPTELSKELDVFHSTDHMIPRLNDIPVIATIHDAIMFQHPEWHSFRFGQFKKMIRKKTFRWPDRYITISHAMVNEIVEFGGLDPAKIDVIYHGVAPEWFERASDEAKQGIREHYQLPQKFILFASTLQEKKNVARLIEAYLQLPADLQDQYPLIIVGRQGWGNEPSMAAVNRLIANKKGLWLNYVPYDHLRILFQCASIYVHPSLHEGFGLTILEAFASQTPVITSQVAALPEIAGGAALLIDPLSVESIQQGLFSLLTTPSLQTEYIEKGLTRAKLFSWDQCAEKTLNVYRSALK